jgi:cell wall-associated NlpC family hydrolase
MVAIAVAIGGCGEAQVGDPASVAHTSGRTGPSGAPTSPGASGVSGPNAGGSSSDPVPSQSAANGSTGPGTNAGGEGSVKGDPGAGGSGAGAGVVHEVADPEEARSFPLPASTPHASATAPRTAGEAAAAPGAPSDAEIKRELGEEEKYKAQERAVQHRALTPVPGGSSVGGNGTIPIPTNVPAVVQRVIAGGNAIADYPYIWGGGHDPSFVANGYDCSGSVSYALAAGGLLGAPLVSGELASWGEPGPGRWITIYANAGHTFMDVDGVWFDTAGRSGPYASRWLLSTPPLAGYAVRHPPGL